MFDGLNVPHAVFACTGGYCVAVRPRALPWLICDAPSGQGTYCVSVSNGRVAIGPLEVAILPIVPCGRIGRIGDIGKMEAAVDTAQFWRTVLLRRPARATANTKDRPGAAGWSLEFTVRKGIRRQRNDFACET